jgi:hypothetical protein
MLGGFLFLIVQLERRPKRRRRVVEALAALMAGCYAAVLLLAPAREFFALARPTATVAALGVGGVLLAWTLAAMALRLSGGVADR